MGDTFGGLVVIYENRWGEDEEEDNDMYTPLIIYVIYLLTTRYLCGNG